MKKRRERRKIRKRRMGRGGGGVMVMVVVEHKGAFLEQRLALVGRKGVRGASRHRLNTLHTS